MSSAYYVKVYYTTQQRQPEIRRFSIDIAPSNDVYQELCTKIATYQPDIQLNGFTLQYIDEENERITFSSNDELRSAISSNRDGNAFKVFVISNNQPTRTSNSECHTGVECDNCKGPVIGFRYKCLTCSNYDLCEKCSTAGIHSDHNMIKITKPSNHYQPYGRRSRPFITPPFIMNPEFVQQIQTQIPQWLPNQENTAQFRAHIQQHYNNIKSNTQAHVQNSKQYLETVGQYLQQTLAPLGVDCDYHVTENNASANANQQQSSISSLLSRLRPSATSATTASATSETPAEKVVEECVEKMKAMGFDDTDESLIQLIRAKNGDLISVLDEINARSKGN